MSSTGTERARRLRSGADTRSAAQRVALELFTTQGYESTSLRQIADALGINKASLYYHFRSKDDILASLFDDRGTEAEELLAWVRAQPPTAALLEAAVLRWVGTLSGDKLRGIRFLAANPLLGSGGAGDGIRAGLTELVSALEALLPDPTGPRRLMLRMAVLSINAAVAASAGTDLGDEEIIEAATRTARLVLQPLANPET